MGRCEDPIFNKMEFPNINLEPNSQENHFRNCCNHEQQVGSWCYFKQANTQSFKADAIQTLPPDMCTDKKYIILPSIGGWRYHKKRKQGEFSKSTPMYAWEQWLAPDIENTN